MKAAAKNKKPADTDIDMPMHALMEQAKTMEKDNPGSAADLYEKITREYPLKEPAWDRLMIIYRKAKNYTSELSVIRRAIKTFEAAYGKANRAAGGKKVSRLSNALAKSFGLVDKKGRSLYEPQPIARWNKRRQTVEARIEK